MNSTNTCVFCSKTGEDLYRYCICSICKSKLGLLTDETILKNIQIYKSMKKTSFGSEITRRLDFIDKDYIRKRIKLLHVKNRLKHI